jgi:hypothetical protein
VRSNTLGVFFTQGGEPARLAERIAESAIAAVALSSAVIRSYSPSP